MASAFKALWNYLRSSAARAGLSGSTRRAIGAEPGLADTSAVAPSISSQLGPYRLEQEIGRGAMGAVYLGRHVQTGEPAAIKTVMLGRGLGSDELKEAHARFRRESETVGLLRHPDIVLMLDAGEAGDIAYIAMEFVTGRDLAYYSNATRLLPVPVLLRIVSRIADALAYAHSKGVVHRDIKPANVMVDLTLGVVKVTDFGVARMADSSRTRSGVVLGTPAFMSPEQMAGGRVDGRSDIYSLGVVLFNLLTGRLPHRAESMAALMFQIANEVPPDVRELRSGLTESLANVVALALQKRPEVRYADGHQFALDLRAVADALEQPLYAGDAASQGTI